MQAVDPLNEHLPQLEQMIAAIQNERYDTLNQQYAELDQIYGMLYGTYVEELQYLAVGDPHNQSAVKIGQQFELLKPCLRALHNELSLKEFSEAEEHLVQLQEHSRTLFELFDEYKAVAATGKKYSDIPYTNELIRVGRHYLNGELAVEAVLGRFEIFCRFHELLENQVETLMPSPPERKTFDERLPDLQEALDLQMHAIEDLDLALDREDDEALAEALEQIAEAGEVLVEVYQALQKADLEPRRISCIRCGADNSIESRLCGACGGVLPQSAALGTPVSTIALEEDGSNVESGESEELTRLRNLVEEAQLTNDPQELLRALSGFRERWERNHRKFERLEAPPADLPPEHGALLSKAKQTFAQALGDLEEGLQLLEDGATVLDAGLLEAGLSRMHDGESLFREFVKEFERAQESS